MCVWVFTPTDNRTCDLDIPLVRFIDHGATRYVHHRGVTDWKTNKLTHTQVWSRRKYSVRMRVQLHPRIYIYNNIQLVNVWRFFYLFSCFLLNGFFFLLCLNKFNNKNCINLNIIYLYTLRIKRSQQKKSLIIKRLYVYCRNQI